MAVPDRNRTLFRCAHYCVQSTVTQYFRYGWDSYTLCQLTNTWYVCTAHMIPTLNGSSVLQLFERGYAIKIHNRMFDFYPRLPHLKFTRCAYNHPSDLMCTSYRSYVYWKQANLHQDFLLLYGTVLILRLSHRVKLCSVTRWLTKVVILTSAPT